MYKQRTDTSAGEPEVIEKNRTPIDRRVLVDWVWRHIYVNTEWKHYCDWKIEKELPLDVLG